MAKDVPEDGKRAVAIKRAGARKTVNAANLATLGPEALAELLLEIGGDYPAVKRRLRLELAGEVGAADLAAELGKRIDTVAQSRARVNWRRYKDFVRELDLTRRAIAGKLAELDPALALPLLVRLADLHGGVFDRANDAKGELAALFAQAVDDAAKIAPRAALADSRALGDQLFDLVAHGRADIAAGLLTAVTPALSAQGIATLRHQVETELSRRPRAHSGLRAAAQALADAMDDVDGYIGYFTPTQLVLPPIGAKVARRLLKAGRIEEAIAALHRSAPRAPAKGPLTFQAPDGGEWDEVHIELLEAQGETAAAQEARWARFEATLSPDRLRDYLKRLPDFDDVVAEDRALDYAASYRDAHAALKFLLEWPALNLAAKLAVERQDELKAHDLGLLAEGGRLLAGRHPLAATVLLRKVVLDIARHARGEDYKAAQTLLLEAASLAPAIDGEDIESHAAFARQVEQFGRW